MSEKFRYSRRGFLRVIGSSSLIGFAPFHPQTATWALAAAGDVRFAYIASDAKDAGAIHVFQVNGSAWKLVQSIASESPSSLAISADKTTLFVANRMHNYQGHPTASVESYCIDRRSGNLRLLSRRPLALSAIGPEHVAVSPDGKYLAVSVTAGGAYNLLPIDPDGRLGGVSVLRKETGASIHPEWQCSARPQQVIFDRRGRLISSDLGSDRVNVLELVDGSLIATQRKSVEPGSGPAAIELNPQTSALFVAGALDGVIKAYAYDEASGKILNEVASAEAFSHPAGRLHAFAVRSSGELVIASWSTPVSHYVGSWRFNRKASSFEAGSTLKFQGAVKALRFLPAGDSLVALDATNGVISSLRLDQPAGNLNSIAQLASAASPSAICFMCL